MSFGETKTEVFRPDDNTKLMTYAWLPKKDIKAVFIAVHGGLAHAGDWVTPALFFKEKGVATYAFDLRYHGTYPQYNPGGRLYFHTTSYDDSVADLHAFHEWVHEKHPGVPIFVLSHSNGALISMKYALSTAKNTKIKGFVISSPWLKNKVKVPAVVQKISKLIAAVHPTFAIKPPSLADQLTHDKKITARHYADEAAGLRGTKVTAKLGVESEKTQSWVIDNIKNWERFPVFAVLAGKDALADANASKQALQKIPESLLTLMMHDKNFHENFNEVNRNETFVAIWKWVQKHTVQ